MRLLRMLMMKLGLVLLRVLLLSLMLIVLLGARAARPATEL
jgi:hypothetical protein